MTVPTRHPQKIRLADVLKQSKRAAAVKARTANRCGKRHYGRSYIGGIDMQKSDASGRKFKGFLFFPNFYENGDLLKNESQRQRYFTAILDYLYKGIEPQFSDEERDILLLWVNTRFSLDNQMAGQIGGKSKEKNKGACVPPTVPPCVPPTVPPCVPPTVPPCVQEKEKEKEEEKDILPLSCESSNVFQEMKSRLNTLFHRRNTTGWNKKEEKKLKEISKHPEALEELGEIEALYNSGYQYRRQDIITLLNNWNGELDRCRNQYQHSQSPADEIVFAPNE